jgi:hypothetical protein
MSLSSANSGFHAIKTKLYCVVQTSDHPEVALKVVCISNMVPSKSNELRQIPGLTHRLLSPFVASWRRKLVYNLEAHRLSHRVFFTINLLQDDVPWRIW